jgi:hypothetical protein
MKNERVKSGIIIPLPHKAHRCVGCGHLIFANDPLVLRGNKAYCLSCEGIY